MCDVYVLNSFLFSPILSGSWVPFLVLPDYTRLALRGNQHQQVSWSSGGQYTKPKRMLYQRANRVAGASWPPPWRQRRKNHVAQFCQQWDSSSVMRISRFGIYRCPPKIVMTPANGLIDHCESQPRKWQSAGICRRHPKSKTFVPKHTHSPSLIIWMGFLCVTSRSIFKKMQARQSKLLQ